MPRLIYAVSVWLSLTVALLAACSSAQTVEWTYELEAGAAAPTLYPAAAAPTGVVVTSGPKVIRLNGNGNALWEAILDENAATPATVADLDGDGTPEIAVALAHGRVVCLDADGQVRWNLDFDTPAGGFKNIVAADVLASEGLELLIGFDDGWLNCISADGALLWRFFGDKFRVGMIAVGDTDGDGETEIVYGTDNGHVYCLSGDGRVEWRYDELAPYGRSGPNIADLDGDGKAEVLITRSNVGNATCLIAIDGATGAFLWRTDDVMQGYVSNAVVDFEGDGQFEVLHCDKGNHIYCENADGSRRWTAELDGRGIFWAPAVADVDSDGQLEVISPMRGESPETGTCCFVVGADGNVKYTVDLGNGQNAGPAVGDIDGDGELEVIVVTQGPDRIQALTWNAHGRVAWASLRSNSAMSARAPNVAQGKPAQQEDFEALVARARQDPGMLLEDPSALACWGENTTRVRLNEPAPEGAFLEVSVQSPEGIPETRILDIRPGATVIDVPWRRVQPSVVALVVAQGAAGHGAPRPVTVIPMNAAQAEECRLSEVEAVCAAAVAKGRDTGADTRGLETRLTHLRAAADAVHALEASRENPRVIAEAATALRKQADALEASAKLIEQYWGAGGTGRFIYWQDPNPWDPFDPGCVPDALALGDPVKVAAYGNEFEDVALTLLNVTAEAFDVRCMFMEPNAGQHRPQGEPDLAKHITLRRSVPVASALKDRVFDALPELDRSRAITLPPGEARQLWLVVKTHGLEPGIHKLTLYLGSLTKPWTVHAVPLEIEVWPVALPTDIYVQMNWSHFNAGQVSDQAVQDMIDHGISCIYGPPLPTVPVDAAGALAGEVDWTGFDETLARAPKHFYMLWGAPPARQWPDGVQPEEDGDEYLEGVRTAIHALTEHLEAHGFGYDQWAFYPIDEPWNTGFTEIPRLKRFCQMIKKAEPRAQVYTDPAGLVRVKYLEEFKDLIDIWQPEMNLLKRDPALVEWFKNNAKHFWAYEAPGPAKDFPPLGHYRAFAWLAWHFGVEGAGYWVYKGVDVWWPVTTGDYSAVYQTNDEVVPSRRWEASRDGVEDYRALYVLREEIERARAAGHEAEADVAQTLMDQSFNEVVGWQIGSIDEITRMTRDTEIDFVLLSDFRLRMLAEIVRLRGLEARD